MTVRELHRDAMAKLKEASVFKELRQKAEFNYALSQALALESEAANLLKDNVETEPTRSVLYRSAANLAFQLKLFKEAHNLAMEGLNGNPSPELASELQIVISKIDDMQSEALVYSQVPTQYYSMPSIVEDAPYDYFNLLTEKAVEFRLIDTSKYGGAVVISHIIEFLKNIQQSFQNYAEVKLERILRIEENENKDYLLSKFRTNTNLLGVGLNWKSFGISVVADDGLIEHIEIYSNEYREMRKKLFDDFKEDVIFPQYNDLNFQKDISQKYTSEERKKIYGPLLNVIGKTKPYTISVTKNNYEIEIKKFRPLTKNAQNVLKPNVTLKSVEHPISIFRTIEQTKGSKKKTLVSEQVTNLEMRTSLSQVSYNKKTLLFFDPYEIIVRFDEDTWRIEDEYLNVFVTSSDYDDVLELYNRSLIESYSVLLLNIKSLSDKEGEVIDRISQLSFRDW